MLDDFQEPYSQGNDAGKLILRLAVAILLLLHGMAKLQNPDIIKALAPSFTTFSLPIYIAWLALVGELLAPLLLITGIFTRLAGGLVAFQMALVMVLGNTSELFSFLPLGGYALELQAMFLFAGVSISCLGSGYYALMRD